LKYKNISIEIQRMLSTKCFVAPVIIEAMGIASKGLKKYLETILGKHSVEHIQKKRHTRNITHHKESVTV
jgi:hypothetical protein